MLRRGAVTDFKKILKWTKRWREEQFNRTTLTYNFTNGSTISFFSADSEAKVRGARRQILYLNEANRIDFETFYALRIRTSAWTIIDFNPTINLSHVCHKSPEDSVCHVFEFQLTFALESFELVPGLPVFRL